MANNHRIDNSNVEFIGDFLLVFSSDTKPGRNRSSSGQWDVLESTTPWTFYVQRPTKNWKGPPWRNYKIDNWNIYLIGELYKTENEKKS